MAKAKKKAAKKKGKKQGSMWVHVFLALIVMMAAVFLSSAIILFIGLMPFFVAYFVDKRKTKTKAITVGAMNMAGCVPFLMELWTTDPSVEKALSIILDPMAIIVIYSAAGVGYLIDWALSMIIASILYQRGVSRKSAIEKRQEELIKRWGEEVSGRVPLDEAGFPIEGAMPDMSVPES